MTNIIFPLPAFSSVEQIAKRWGVTTAEVMQHYGNAKFLYGAISDHLQTYDREEVLAEVRAEAKGENSYIAMLRFAENDLPRLEAKMVWLSRDEVMRLEQDTQPASTPKMVAEAVEARNNLYIKSQTDKAPFIFDDGTTTLTEYLELDTWTPEQAACLVAGIKPETMTCSAKRPNDLAYQTAASLSRMQLRGCDAWSAETNLSIMGEGITSFETRMRVLKLWNSQENPPSKVRPDAFVAWCETKKIDTGWLTNAPEWEAVPAVKDEVTTTRQRRDAMAVELDEILLATENRTPANVMAELRKRIGRPDSCITANGGDGLTWENDRGNVKNLTIRALQERIKEWKKTGLTKAKHRLKGQAKAKK